MGTTGPVRQGREPRDWQEQLKKEAALLWDSSVLVSLASKADSLMRVSPN